MKQFKEFKIGDIIKYSVFDKTKVLDIDYFLVIDLRHKTHASVFSFTKGEILKRLKKETSGYNSVFDFSTTQEIISLSELWKG